ncbi:6-pyruvoyl trahydropterin synthase family protein [Nitratireductor thuwali]|uniref:6-carboxy-5,6,7,8-tetrahydropterin synthase n=1 Tax=Nitratireductor thuwali TaxID=2267699 RepID=A0ABY5MJA6_9HYPH|nr:6-carboxy-5,6,7,8-tetrahydropterin synthase [Nitratireductor thuwali]
MTKPVETYKEFTFEAAHELPPYSGLHGHSFKVRIALTGEPDPKFGWSANLYEVERKIEEIHKTLDHGYLNQVEGLSVPSLENIAAWIWHKLHADLPAMSEVAVSRGPDGQAEGCVYRG